MRFLRMLRCTFGIHLWCYKVKPCVQRFCKQCHRVEYGICYQKRCGLWVTRWDERSAYELFARKVFGRR